MNMVSFPLSLTDCVFPHVQRSDFFEFELLLYQGWTEAETVRPYAMDGIENWNPSYNLTRGFLVVQYSIRNMVLHDLQIPQTVYPIAPGISPQQNFSVPLV